jgi:flavin-dependent dehydrogenase
MFKTTQSHLERFGLLQEILDEGHGKWADKGGLVSPGGLQYLGASAKPSRGSLALSVKRTILDEKLARLAQKAGATLVEECDVGKVEFSTSERLWNIASKTEVGGKFKSRVLVAADGSVSTVARSLGLVKSVKETDNLTVCSTAYIEAGTHEYDQDGVVFYVSELVPGYVSLFREADNTVSYCCYVLPGGSCGPRDLKRMHHEILENYKPVRDALGEDAKIEDMKAAPIRYGMEKTTCSDHLLIVGDAAGHADPLTGGGIQYALDAGEIAAQTLAEAFQKGDFSKKFLSRYHRRCLKKFGNDHRWSLKMTRFLAKHPIYLDAFAAASMKRGDEFMAKWAQIMCGARSKRQFFLPTMFFPLMIEVSRLKLGKERAQAYRPGIPKRSR